MYVKLLQIVVVGAILSLSKTTYAQGIDYSIGAGYPFFVVPELSYVTSDTQQRWYANYKVGLEDGFNIGYEHSVTQSNRHTIGAAIGAIGIHQNDTPCDGIQSLTACIVANLFDEEVVNGVAISYGYFFNQIENPGWFVKLELGYGRGAESDDNTATGSFRFGYQF